MVRDNSGAAAILVDYNSSVAGDNKTSEKERERERWVTRDVYISRKPGSRDKALQGRFIGSRLGYRVPSIVLRN